MSARRGGFYTMEALALVSAICIAGIFVFSHFSRQVDTLDQKAMHLAEEAKPVVQAFFEKEPQGDLSLETLRQGGLSWPQSIEVKIPEYQRKIGDWRVDVWHTQGDMIYSLSAQGLQKHLR